MVARVEIDDTALDAFLDETVHRDLERRAFNVENDLKRLLRMHGTGRIYTRRFYRDREGRLRMGGRRPPHQASAPGRPPASDTGRLLNSVYHEIVGIGTDLTANIGYTANYGAYLELGTRYMAPRPALRPALYSGFDAQTGLLTEYGEEKF